MGATIVKKLVLLLALLCVPAWAITPPTIASRVETAAWTTTGASKAMTVSWLAADVLVTACVAENNDTLGVPTATGLTFTSQESRAVASACAIRISTATAAADGTSVSVSVSNSSSAHEWGCVTTVLRGSGGIGNHTSTATPGSAQTVSLTPTQADSYILWVSGDFASATPGTITPTATLEIEKTQSPASCCYTVYAADLNDQTSAGATSYGTSGGGTGPFTIGAIEIKGTASAATPAGNKMDKLQNLEGAALR